MSDDSAVYFQQRGHFSLVVGMTITLYEDSSRISPPVEEKHVESIPHRPLNLCISVFLQVPPFQSFLPALGNTASLTHLYRNSQDGRLTQSDDWGEEESETLGGWFFHRSWEFCTYSGRACLLALHLRPVLIITLPLLSSYILN